MFSLTPRTFPPATSRPPQRTAWAPLARTIVTKGAAHERAAGAVAVEQASLALAGSGASSADGHGFAAAAAAAAMLASCGALFSGGQQENSAVGCEAAAPKPAEGAEAGGEGEGGGGAPPIRREDSRMSMMPGVKREDSRSAMWPNRDRPSEIHADT